MVSAADGDLAVAAAEDAGHLDRRPCRSGDARPPAKAAEKAAPKGVPAGGKSAAEQQLASVLGAPAGGATDLAGPFTDKRFKPLHDLVEGTGGAPPAIDGVMGNLNDLYIAMNRLGASGDATKALDAGGADGGGAAKLQADAARLPEPLKGMIGQLTKSSSTLTVGGARAQLNALWTA